MGEAVVPPDFGTGSIVINAGTQYIGSIDLPASSSQQQIVPFVASIAGAPVSGTYETFNLVLEQSGGGGASRSTTCGGALPLQLIDPTAVYTGSFATPRLGGHLLPPGSPSARSLRPAGPDGSRGVGCAHHRHRRGLRLPAGAGGRHRQAMGRDHAPGLTQRVTRPGHRHPPERGGGRPVDSEPSGNALLSVTGSAATLPEQGTLLSSTMAKLVQTTSATVVKPLVAPTVQLNPITFNQLGLSGTSTFSGQQQLSFAIDETRLGGVATSMAVVLKAAYSPVETGAKATAQVTVGGVTLATQQLDGSGTLDLPFTIPAPVIRRSTVVLLTVTYFPAGFSCHSAGRTMAFTVDPRSTIQVTNAPGGTGGFPGLPQSLGSQLPSGLRHARCRPAVDCGPDGVRAAAAVVGLVASDRGVPRRRRAQSAPAVVGVG